MSETDPIIDLDNRRRRTRYRAWHRGMLEMDMILGPFADAHVDTYDEAQMIRLEVLMDESDADLLSWILGREKPTPEVDESLVAELTAFQLSRTAAK